jgi:hypothetical protein
MKRPRIPSDVSAHLRRLLWARADEIGWRSLSDADKSSYYEQWTDDEEIGGVLAHYRDRVGVRVHIKDTLMKPYTRARSSDESRPFRVLGLSSDLPIAEAYIKPHGRRLQDGRVICWGPAEGWKLTLMLTFERAYEARGTPFGVVLEDAVGNFGNRCTRAMVEDASTRLVLFR